MSLKFTILGCGTSTGVPRIGPVWGNCDPANPKNFRTRCSLLVKREAANGETAVLVDTTPDMRQQLLSAGISWIDGVFYTHEHADHTHGIDDLRALFFNRRRRVDVYYDRATGAMLRHRFAYCFESPPGSNYPPILEGRQIEAYEPVTISGDGGIIEALPFTQVHGDINTFGFRFGNVAYSPDINGLPAESASILQDLDLWIIDALRYDRHPSHYSLKEALAVIEDIAPKRAILTHMHIDLDYETLRRELPPHIEPAYDGMVVEVDG